MKDSMRSRFKFLSAFILLGLTLSPLSDAPSWGAGVCERSLTADVVALDQQLVFNPGYGVDRNYWKGHLVGEASAGLADAVITAAGHYHLSAVDFLDLVDNGVPLFVDGSINRVRKVLPPGRTVLRTSS